MRIKLKGKNEFEAFKTIAKIIQIELIGRETPTDLFKLKSIEKLIMKLMQIALRHGQFGKKISVNIDELQCIVLYEMLQEIPLYVYEMQLANCIIAQIEQQYNNERALRMSSINRT
ncbi:MAG: hypothetical protein LBE04_05740 [Prevotellaceae bacterium]|jgi:hypothetical protein|nr:hypothetical protein [Prevotellaceae bacterium]